MSWESFLDKSYGKLKTLGIELTGINTVRFHSNEPLEHRFIKFLIAHHLFEKKHYFKTEQPIKSARCDVIDLENFVVFEVERYPTDEIRKKKLDDFHHNLIQDIVIVDIRKLNANWHAVHEIADSVKKYCCLSD